MKTVLGVYGRFDGVFRVVEHIPQMAYNQRGKLISHPTTPLGNGYYKMILHDTDGSRREQTINGGRIIKKMVSAVPTFSSPIKSEAQATLVDELLAAVGL